MGKPESKKSAKTFETKSVWNNAPEGYAHEFTLSIGYKVAEAAIAARKRNH